jgi:hypothetical protein
MNFDNLTIKDIKNIKELFSLTNENNKSLNDMIGHYVIIRTNLAGVWFGNLNKKSGNEVILSCARRLWRWWAKESISLSAVALYGVKYEKSKVAPPVDSIWLEAIEIIPTSPIATTNLMEAPNAQAE